MRICPALLSSPLRNGFRNNHFAAVASDQPALEVSHPGTIVIY